MKRPFYFLFFLMLCEKECSYNQLFEKLRYYATAFNYYAGDRLVDWSETKQDWILLIRTLMSCVYTIFRSDQRGRFVFQYNSLKNSIVSRMTMKLSVNLSTWPSKDDENIWFHSSTQIFHIGELHDSFKMKLLQLIEVSGNK